MSDTRDIRDIRDDAFVGASRLLARRVGLRLDPSVRGRLARGVAAEAEARGLQIDTYVMKLASDAVTLQGLLNRITVQETAFFRDEAQFDALARHVLPTLREPITIWSAGCANGQEPYSLAMTLDERGHVESRVLASDVSTQALDRTRRGCYSANEVRMLTPERRRRYLTRKGEELEISPALRARVEVSLHNLATDPPPFAPGSCPVIFCRNVLIYFSHAEVVRLLSRFADWLPPGGWLFLGYAESLWHVTERFQLVRLDDAFVYRRIDREMPGVRDAPAPRAVSRKPKARDKRIAESSRLRSAHAVEAAEGPTTPVSDVVELSAIGEAAIGAGDFPTAIASFRRCTYLEPLEPVAHLQLGLALEASGDAGAARRAYAAARAALDNRNATIVEATLEGYHVGELVRLLDRKLVERR